MSWDRILWVLLLSLLVWTAFGDVAEHGFISYDDPRYVTQNSALRGEWTGREILWAFTTTQASNWHPLTWLSLMADRRLFGLNPAGYHLTNLLLHLLSGLLLFHVLDRMTGRSWRSGLVAALFLLHPLHVESVAWISERKDVLSALFWMLGCWAYVRYVERPVTSRFWPVTICFLLGLLSKPMVVTFPFVLLLLDWWPLGRMRDGGKVLWLVREKIPLFLLAIAGSAITFFVQQQAGAVASLSGFPLQRRTINAIVAYGDYLVKAFWPHPLAVFYPYPEQHPEWRWLIFLAVLIFLTAGSLLRARRYPYGLTGWLWYLGTLVPVIGLVQVGPQAMADRYTYLPLIGLFVVMVWGMGDLLQYLRISRPTLLLITGALLVVLTGATHRQVGFWKDTVTLFTQAVEQTHENPLAHYTLGLAYSEGADWVRAEAHYRRAIGIEDRYEQAHNALGHLLMIQGRYTEAEWHLEKAVSLRSSSAARKNLGDLAMRLGKVNEALYHYRLALRWERENPELQNNYGVALFQKGDAQAALPRIREALRLKPDYREARENLERIVSGRAFPGAKVDVVQGHGRDSR